jgi:hypothetical protein
VKKHIRAFSTFILFIIILPMIGCIGKSAETTDPKENEVNVPNQTELQVQVTTAEKTKASHLA